MFMLTAETMVTPDDIQAYFSGERATQAVRLLKGGDVPVYM